MLRVEAGPDTVRRVRRQLAREGGPALPVARERIGRPDEPLATFVRRLAALPLASADAGPRLLARSTPGWVSGHMTGAQALVEALLQEGTCCVFGIPGAQQNELWDTMKSKVIAEAEVMERFGVPPSKVIEVQALIGDSTDNVPGVPGIGVKTAALLINEFGDLDSLLASAS